MGRTTDVDINCGPRCSNHIDIFDVETNRYTSRNRCDIRLYKRTKVDNELMVDITRYANKLKRYMEAEGW